MIRFTLRNGMQVTFNLFAVAAALLLHAYSGSWTLALGVVCAALCAGGFDA